MQLQTKLVPGRSIGAPPPRALSIPEAIALNERTVKDAAKRGGVAKISALPAKAQNAIARGEGYQLVPVAQTVRSPFNREHFDPEKLAELTESVRTHGVLEPILVRPVKADDWFIDPGIRSGKTPIWTITNRAWVERLKAHGGLPFLMPTFFSEAEAQANFPRFEIIAGERRWLAAKGAKLEQIPAIVRDLDDRQTIELQIIENLQREDVRPMDEARSFQRLIDFGYKIEELVAKLNRSKSSIYGRLKLLELPDEALKAVEAGTLPASHAELITRIDDKAAAVKLTKELLKPETNYRSGKAVEEQISFRDAKRKTDEAADALEREKKWQEQTASYRDDGLQVLTIAQSVKVFNYGSLKAGYVGANDKCDLDPQGRTWKVLMTRLGEEGKAIIAYNNWGSERVRIVFPRKATVRILVEGGLVAEKAPEISAAEVRKREEERLAAAKEAQRIKDEMIIGQIVAAAETRELNANTWGFLATALLQAGGLRWQVDPLLQRRGITKEPLRNFDKLATEFGKLTEKADGKKLRGLIVELLLWAGREGHGDRSDFLPKAARVFGAKVQASGKPATKAVRKTTRLTPAARAQLAAAMKARWAARMKGKK